MIGNFHKGDLVQDIKDFLQGASATTTTENQISSFQNTINIVKVFYPEIDTVEGHREAAVSNPSVCPGNLAMPILIERGIINTFRWNEQFPPD